MWQTVALSTGTPGLFPAQPHTKKCPRFSFSQSPIWTRPSESKHGYSSTNWTCSVASSSSKKTHDQQLHTKHEEVDLMHWLQMHGLNACKVALKDKPVHGQEGKPIHSVVASEKLQAGDLVLSIPMSLVVTLERVLGNETIAELLTTNKLSELACLALYLMYEKKRGHDSFWYPFIRELDRQRGRGQLAVESPLLWSQEELDEYFHGSPVKEVILERLEGIKREYRELDTVWFMSGSLFNQYPFDIPSEAFSFKIFKQAFVAVLSCVVHLQGVSLPRRFALVPLGPPLLAYKSSCKAMLKAVGDEVQLEVDRPYEAGDPILVWCGPQPNSRLLLNYGFVDADNLYDRLAVEVALDTNDPLYQKKRILVQKHNLSTIQVFQIYVGKEKDAILQMLPYMRLAHVSVNEDVDSVFSVEGLTSPVSACNERAVLDQLAEYFQSRIDGYRTTLEEDKILLEDVNICPKRRVATQLVLIEKKILQTILEVINELRRDLPDISVSPCTGPFAPRLK